MLIKLQNVRLAFSQNLFKPGAMNNDPKAEPAYSSTLLIPKNDPQVAMIREAIEKVAAEKWSAKASQILKGLIAENKVCLRDGDNKEQYEGFAGCVYIQARNKQAPMVLNRDKTPLQEKDGRPYAGCYVNASIDIWPQDNSYGKRINAKLRWVQYVKDGDAFTGSAPPSEDEVDDLGDTGEQPATEASAPAGNPWA